MHIYPSFVAFLLPSVPTLIKAVAKFTFDSQTKREIERLGEEREGWWYKIKREQKKKRRKKERNGKKAEEKEKKDKKRHEKENREMETEWGKTTNKKTIDKKKKAGKEKKMSKT